MLRQILLTFLTCAVSANADLAEGTMVPPVQGAYVGARVQGTANPWNAGIAADFGWREVLYEAQHPALAYNYIGMEFVSQAILQEVDNGVRVVLQPTSFLQTSLSYLRIGYLTGLISMAGDPQRPTAEIWDDLTDRGMHWADQFTWQWSLQKEIGSVQGRFSGHWSRIDIDDVRDSLYLPSQDIIVRPRDDLVGWEFSACYISQAPFLTAVGPAVSTLRSVDHRVQSDRAGIWLQAWPFSKRTGDVIPYWTLRSRLDLWTDYSLRQWQPRMEITIGWERNIFQPPSP